MASAAVAVVELTSGRSLVDALLAAGVVTCALQLGYLLGLSVKRVVADPKAARTERAAEAETNRAR